MSDFMTVGQVREALLRYDPDRLIASGSTPIVRVVSVEPGGVVSIICDTKHKLDPTNTEIQIRDESGYWITPPFGSD